MTDATSDAEPDTDLPDGEEPPQFENRAARRSKGKGAKNHTGSTPGHVTGRSSNVQSPRQYGNRRSG